MSSKKRSNKLKKFSHENATWLCDEVTRLAELDEASAEEMIELLRELVEVTVWGDKNEDSVFDIFLERDMMSTFEATMTSATLSTGVRVQVIQCIVILLQNLSRQQSFYFVCSNNHINKMILAELDEDDEELMSNYVSFLKSVCLRLNDDSVQFFFSRETSSFPLFERGMRLLSNEDRIVRAAARQIAISVAQLREPSIVAFIQKNSGHIFGAIVELMRSQLFRIDDNLRTRDFYLTTASPTVSLRVIDEQIEDLLDDAYYLNDWFGISHSFIAVDLHQILLEKLIRGLLLPSIRPPQSGQHIRVITEALALHFAANWVRINTVQQIFDSLSAEFISPDGPLVGVLRSTRVRSHLFAVSLTFQLVNSKHNCNEADSLLPRPRAQTPSPLESRGDDVWTPEGNAKLWSDKPGMPSLTKERESCSDNALIAAVFSALQMQLRFPETVRMHPFLYILNKFCLLWPGTTKELLTDLDLLAAAAQNLLRRRAEKYHHHLEVLYGGAGATSLLTPSSLLCQLMDATVSEHEMCNEFEAMFVRLERDARQAEPLVASVTDKVGRDVQFLATPLPCLALISADLQELLEGDAAQGDRNAAAYLDFQERSFAGVAIANRPPRDEDELEFVELMLFCFLRSKCFREIFGVADPIHKRIDKFSVRRKPRDEVTLRELRKLCDIDGLKCEFAPELTEVATTPSAGTALYIFLDYNDVLLVEPNREVPDKSLVAFALQANYTECIINKQKFKLLLQFEGPFSRMKVPLAFRDRAVCQAVASAIHKQSRMWGFYSQQLVRSFIFGPVVTEDA